MEQESEYGNIEYKLKLCIKSNKRLEELTSQMAFRLNEGNGECIYVIGVSDMGELSGITEEEYQFLEKNLFS